MINEENWFDEYYSFQDQKAQIFMGIEEDIYYAVTVFDEEKTYFQEQYEDLNQAIERINHLFSQWDFSAQNSSSGCGSCAAH